VAALNISKNWPAPRTPLLRGVLCYTELACVAPALPPPPPRPQQRRHGAVPCAWRMPQGVRRAHARWRVGAPGFRGARGRSRGARGRVACRGTRARVTIDRCSQKRTVELLA
jgi:hypothetical protein